MSSKTHHYQIFLWQFDEKSSNNAKIANFLAQNVHSGNNFGAPKLPDLQSVARFGPEYSKKSPILVFWPILGKNQSEIFH